MSASIPIVSHLRPEMQVEGSAVRFLFAIQPIPDRNACKRGARGDADVLERLFSFVLRPVAVVAAGGRLAMATVAIEAAAVTERAPETGTAARVHVRTTHNIRPVIIIVPCLHALIGMTVAGTAIAAVDPGVICASRRDGRTICRATAEMRAIPTLRHRNASFPVDFLAAVTLCTVVEVVFSQVAYAIRLYKADFYMRNDKRSTLYILIDKSEYLESRPATGQPRR